MSQKSHARGFTLIELLVVITIIGILSSIVLASLSTARIKGQDASRITNIKSLETAIEFYFNDNKTYPQIGSAGVSTGIASLSTFLVSGPNKYIGVIASNLIADNDLYAWGPANSYAFEVYQGMGGGSWCKAGVNNTALFVGVPDCKF